MPTLNEIVNVTIDRQTRPVTAAGFGLPLFVGLHKAFTERYREYTSIEAVADDFSTSSKEYKAAQQFFGQDISVDRIAIGRRSSTTATLTPVVQNSATYTVTINGTLFSFVSDADATDAEIVTGLSALINADGPLPVTASGTTTLILTHDSGGDFSLKFSTNLTASYAVASTLTADLTLIANESNDWYGLSAYTHVTADILELAAYAQSAKKLYGASSSEANIKDLTDSGDTTSVAAQLKAAGYDRTFLLYSANADIEFPECAWFGKEFARDPGASTWKFKTLTGVTVDNLTPTQDSNILAKNANNYTRVAGVNITSNGTVMSGEFIDIIRDLDWLIARIQERIYFRFVNLPKVPFTDTGISIIESELRAQLLQAIDRGVIADDTPFTITVPKSLDVAPNDRANRLLPDVRFTARVAGAVHAVEIRGVVTV